MSSAFPTARFPSLPLRRGATVAEPLLEEAHAPVIEPSDEALIVRICAADTEALDLLFRRYARLVWSIGRRILRSSVEADDLLQDVFLLVCRRASVFDPSKGSVRSLLVQMCYQRAFSRRRDLARQNFHISSEVTESANCEKRCWSVSSYDEGLEAHFGKAALSRALADLSGEQCETLRLCFFEGHTLEEIAARLGQSYGNVRHHYYRGLARLRNHLRGSG